MLKKLLIAVLLSGLAAMLLPSAATASVGKQSYAPGTPRCDSGVVNWTARPVYKFSPPQIPPCTLSATCPIP